MEDNDTEEIADNAVEELRVRLLRALRSKDSAELKRLAKEANVHDLPIPRKWWVDKDTGIVNFDK